METTSLNELFVVLEQKMENEDIPVRNLRELKQHGEEEVRISNIQHPTFNIQ